MDEIAAGGSGGVDVISAPSSPVRSRAAVPAAQPAAVAQPATVAPYAVVRSSVLAPPAPSRAAHQFRTRAARLLELTTWSTRVSGDLTDALRDAVASAAPDLRAKVLLPLRRDVHNQRTPRPALRARLGDLPDRMPLLRQWLDARDEVGRLGIELAELADAALRADRMALAEMCRSDALCRAVALTSEDLLRAVRRAARQGALPDDRARKSEPAVLRYALRASTKTVPLSWFTQVGWGRWWDGAAAADPDVTAAGGGPVAVAQADRAALTALVQALLGRPDLRATLPHRLAPGLRTRGAGLRFHRLAPSGDAPPGMVREEEAALPLTGPLRHLLAAADRAGGTVLPRVLAAEIAGRLPGPPQSSARTARAYVSSLIDQGVLRPAYPIDPQAVDALGGVARWLTDLGQAELAAVVRDIDARTAAFAQVPAVERPQALAQLRARWADAFSIAGAPPAGRRMPVTEDVMLPAPLPLGPGQGRDTLPHLARLAPLLEIFDQYLVIRRLARDRFVARFGVGGRCDSPTDFASDFGEVWHSLSCFDPSGAITPDGGRTFSPQLHALAGLRAGLVGAVRAGAGGESHLPEQAVMDAARLLPRWLRARPASYAIFGQPVPDGPGGAGLVVNQVYGGWGRFTSRFLDYFGPAAAREVAAQIAGGLGGRSRVAQIRPVSGFNGNLHPLLVDDEIRDDGGGGGLLPEDLHLVHDVATDQLRLRVTATGELVDVLYLGFLVPIVLPQRLVATLTDLGTGLVDLTGALVGRQRRDTEFGPITHRPRLRYRNVVLSRAQWRLPPSMVRRWRDELDREPGPAVRTTVRWRHLLGLPERLFVAAAPDADAKGMAAFMSYYEQAKSQYLDLGSALHLRCLSRTLARYPDGVVLEEALPEPRAGVRPVEVVAETYRRAP